MTSAFPATAWLYWIGGGVLGILGLWLLYWSLLRDRSRGRRRCPRCWYDMSATPPAANNPSLFTCSECGKVVKRERQLFRTRRHWWRAGIALAVLAIAYVGFNFPRVQRDGWMVLVPTTALILALPHSEFSASGPTNLPGYGPATWNYDAVLDALEQRIRLAALSDPQRCGLYGWQWWLLLQQASAPHVTSQFEYVEYAREHFYGAVIAHAIRVGGSAKSAWPFRRYGDALLSNLAITGHAYQRNGTNVVEWELQCPTTLWHRWSGTIRAIPRNAPPKSLGIWIPRELVAPVPPDPGVWAVQDDGPGEPRTVEFDIYISIAPDFDGSQIVPTPVVVAAKFQP